MPYTKLYNDRWAAILKPGLSGRFFQTGGRGESRRPWFQARNLAYSPVNAWWLSEISRLIYVREADENGGHGTGIRRSAVLSAVNLREYCFIGDGGVQCALITSCDNVEIPFAVLVFRGTSAFETWLSNLNTIQTEWQGGGLVHAGFKNEFCRIWGDVERLVQEVPAGFPLFYTGHSLGGAMAVLAAARHRPQAVYTFGSPRVGDAAFAHSLRDIPIFQIVNSRDLVSQLPPSRIPFDFCHAGRLLTYSGNGRGLSPALGKRRRNPSVLLKQRLMAPPEFLSDHAPVNYSLRLLEEILPR